MYLLVSLITQKKHYRGHLSDRCWPRYTASKFRPTCISSTSTRVWQYFYVIKHRPVGIGSLNFASVILYPGLTNWYDVLICSLNFILWTTLLVEVFDCLLSYTYSLKALT